MKNNNVRNLIRFIGVIFFISFLFSLSFTFVVNREQSKAVDFSNAGLSTNRMMVPPKVSSTAGLQNPVQGALVFNTTANKLQFYNGTSWVNV